MKKIIPYLLCVIRAVSGNVPSFAAQIEEKAVVLSFEGTVESTPLGLISKNRLTVNSFSYLNEKESTYRGLNVSRVLCHFVLDNFYIENKSNDLFQKYSGSVIPGGGYSNF